MVPDNVLFEGGAGETIRRKLLHECDVHTLLRLPTGIFYAQGVKANVLFFDRKPPAERPGRRSSGSTTCGRTRLHAQDQQLARSDLDDFVACYHADNREERARRSASSRSPTTSFSHATRHPRHLLAAGRVAGGHGQPPGARCHRRRDRRRPSSGSGRVQRDCLVTEHDGGNSVRYRG